jgi:hypothetical protein
LHRALSVLTPRRAAFCAQRGVESAERAEAHFMKMWPPAGGM